MRLTEEEIKKYTADYFDIEFEEYPERVNAFLYFLKRQGYVRLAEDNKSPEITKETVLDALKTVACEDCEHEGCKDCPAVLQFNALIELGADFTKFEKIEDER